MAQPGVGRDTRLTVLSSTWNVIRMLTYANIRGVPPLVNVDLSRPSLQSIVDVNYMSTARQLSPTTTSTAVQCRPLPHEVLSTAVIYHVKYRQLPSTASFCVSLRFCQLLHIGHTSLPRMTPLIHSRGHVLLDLLSLPVLLIII